MFQIQVVEKNNTHIVRSKNFSPKSYRLRWDNVEKYGAARQARGDNIMRRRRKVATCMSDN